MAKKPTVRGLFDTTQEAPEEKPVRGEDPIKARGIGLKASEWATIDERAKAIGWNSHRLAVALLRYGLADLLAGKIKTKTVTQKELDL